MKKILIITLLWNALFAGMLLLTAALVVPEGEIHFPDRDHRVCDAQWCLPGATDATAQAWINDQVADFGCNATSQADVIPSAVLATATKPGEGTTVVKRYTFDRAWDGAQAGDLRIVGFCYSA